MRSTILKTLLIAVPFVGGLLLGDSARAAVTTVNSPSTSTNTIAFIDTNSLDPSLNPGGSYIQVISPWGGVPSLTHTLPLTTDPIGDFAKGSITADVIAGNYSLTLNSVLLNQAP